jgi:protein O-GlcNAc transferase
MVDFNFNRVLFGGYSMREVRAKVWLLRSTSELFNVETYTANLERVYRRMWEKYENGEEVTHLTELAEPYS